MVLGVSGWLPSVLRTIALPRLLRTQCPLTACLPLPWSWPGYSSCMQSWGWMFDYSLVQIVLQALAICQPVHGPKKRLCTQSRVKTGASVESLQGHGQDTLLTASGPTVSVPWSPPELSGVCGSLPLYPQLSCGELSETAARCSLALPPFPWPGGSAHSPSLPRMFICKLMKWPCPSGKWIPFLGEKVNFESEEQEWLVCVCLYVLHTKS